MFGATCVFDEDLGHEELLLVAADDRADDGIGDPDGVRVDSHNASISSTAHGAIVGDCPGDAGAVDRSNIAVAPVAVPSL